ncbi:hypothetical protein MKW92_049043, partial [Papaver armeniacum]
MSGGVVRRIISPLYSSSASRLLLLKSQIPKSNLSSQERERKFDKMVEDYRNGNKKMIRVLLNAMLARKLSGKHDDGADKKVFAEISKELRDRENYLIGRNFTIVPFLI